MDFLFSALVIVMFFLIGSGLIWAGVRSWVEMVRIRPRLLKAQGVVTNIVTESKAMRTPNGSNTYDVHRFPVIHFHTPAGEERSFRSEVGEVETRCRHSAWGLTPKRKGAHEFQYVVGQAITVLYDPLGEVAPRLDSWSALNGVSLALIMGGLAFCGTAVLLGAIFGTKLVSDASLDQKLFLPLVRR